MADIFISYRRSDSAAMCDRIYTALVQHFGKDAIFKDIDNIPLGVNFGDYIRTVLAQSAVVLVVIGRTWLDVTDAAGHRRLDDPGDFVRLEIEVALARHIPVIPLLVDGAPMPNAERLPESLRGLLIQNGWEVHYDPYFETDIRRVIAGCDRLVRARQGEFAHPQEAAQHEALATLHASPITPTYAPSDAVAASVSYSDPALVVARPKKSPVPWPWRRVFLYGVGFGVAAAAIGLGKPYVGVFGQTFVQTLQIVVVAAAGLAVAAPAFLIRYRNTHFWAGVLASCLAGLIAPILSLPDFTVLDYFAFSVVYGVIGGLIGALGGLVAMLLLRVRPKRPRESTSNQPAFAISQATTRPPSTP